VEVGVVVQQQVVMLTTDVVVDYEPDDVVVVDVYDWEVVAEEVVTKFDPDRDLDFGLAVQSFK
jgi:3-polyprenyl-4-hydroxybenzoate decarboxylase